MGSLLRCCAAVVVVVVERPRAKSYPERRSCHVWTDELYPCSSP
jgi:hypothetical protein